jgi:hypothetical protein
MKKYNVYYTLSKSGKKVITKYYFLDAKNETDAIAKANDKSKQWEAKGYSFKVDYAEISNWFAI